MQPTSIAEAVTNDELTEALTPANYGNGLRRGRSESIGLQDFTPHVTDSEQQRLLRESEDDGSQDTLQGDDDGTEPEKQATPRPSLVPRASRIGRRLSFVGEEEAPLPADPSPPSKPKPVAWRDLPNKKQLAILTLARLSEPLTQTSLRAYMFYQLKSFDPSLPDSTISSQAGILEGSFAASQFLTAILWGRAADAEWCGRKKVLLVGLSGTCLSCVGFGFSRSFWHAVMFRAMGGALNGNVGVMRTMISEIIKEKKYFFLPMIEKEY